MKEGIIFDVELIKVFCSRAAIRTSTSTCYCADLLGTQDPCDLGQNGGMRKNAVLPCDDSYYQPWPGGSSHCIASGDDCCKCARGAFSIDGCINNANVGGQDCCKHAHSRFLGGYHDGSGLPWGTAGSAGPEVCLSDFSNCCNGICT